jgi:predicted RNA binding protein YcfA (HicA-like mRNA interferase family)
MYRTMCAYIGATGVLMSRIETDKRRIVARLLHEAWVLVRHGGDHDRRPDRPGMVAVPRHREITVGTARSIAKQAGWI